MSENKREEQTFAEFVEKCKKDGYEVRVTQSFLQDLEDLEKPYTISIWDLAPIPFEFAEDLLDKLPRNRLTRWLSSWMATLAIYANKPFHQRIRRTRKPQRSYRIA